MSRIRINVAPDPNLQEYVFISTWEFAANSRIPNVDRHFAIYLDGCNKLFQVVINEGDAEYENMDHAQTIYDKLRLRRIKSQRRTNFDVFVLAWIVECRAYYICSLFKDQDWHKHLSNADIETLNEQGLYFCNTFARHKHGKHSLSLYVDTIEQLCTLWNMLTYSESLLAYIELLRLVCSWFFVIMDSTGDIINHEIYSQKIGGYCVNTNFAKRMEIIYYAIDSGIMMHESYNPVETTYIIPPEVKHRFRLWIIDQVDREAKHSKFIEEKYIMESLDYFVRPGDKEYYESTHKYEEANARNVICANSLNTLKRIEVTIKSENMQSVVEWIINFDREDDESDEDMAPIPTDIMEHKSAYQAICITVLKYVIRFYIYGCPFDEIVKPWGNLKYPAPVIEGHAPPLIIQTMGEEAGALYHVWVDGMFLYKMKSFEEAFLTWLYLIHKDGNMNGVWKDIYDFNILYKLFFEDTNLLDKNEECTYVTF